MVRKTLPIALPSEGLVKAIDTERETLFEIAEPELCPFVIKPELESLMVKPKLQVTLKHRSLVFMKIGS